MTANANDESTAMIADDVDPKREAMRKYAGLLMQHKVRRVGRR